MTDFSGALDRTLVTRGCWVDEHAKTAHRWQLIDQVGHPLRGAGPLNYEFLASPVSSGRRR